MDYTKALVMVDWMVLLMDLVMVQLMDRQMDRVKV